MANTVIVTEADIPAEETAIIQPENLSETEKMLAEQTQQEVIPEVTGTENPENEASDKPEDDSEGGVDLSKYEQEFTEKGELSEDSIKEVAKALNIPAKYIQSHVDAVKAANASLVNQTRGQVIEYVGSETQYNTMIDWASKNLSEAEKKHINAHLSSLDMDEIKIGLDVLTTRYNKANPPKASSNKIITGGKPPAAPAGVKPYSSRNEWLADVQNPRYEKDEAYRDAVGKRLAYSSI